MSYALKEGLSGFTRAKLSTTISIITICISLLLLGTFVAIFFNLHHFAESIRQEVQIEVFLEDTLPDEDRLMLENTIKTQAGVLDLVYISKEDAAEIFQEEFGEDIYSILDFNPLPRSYRISLEPGYLNPDSAYVIAARFGSMEGVESVLYRQTLLELLTTHIRTFIAISASLGILLAISAIFLVSNTIKLSIYAKRKLIETMKLVGAKRSLIRRPFIIEGFIQGLAGGLAASLLIYIIIFYISDYLPPATLITSHYEWIFFGLILITGIFLGVLGSTISIRKFLN